MPCTRRSVSKQYKVVCTLELQENTHGKSINLALKWNRLSQVLTLFYSRIPEQNFLFDMIYDCLFESVWFTFREQVAPAPNQNLDKIKAFRLSASCHSRECLTSCRKPKKITNKPQSRCYDYHFYDDRWLSFWNDLWLSFWEPSRFYWTIVR